MYQKLVVGVDFSEKSERAIAAAVRLVKSIAGAELVLVHAVALATQAEVADDGEGNRLATLEQRLKTQASALAAAQSINVDYGVVEGPSAARALIEYVTRWGGHLVVVGTQQHSTLNRILIGSVAQTVVELSPVPVMVVGPSVTG
ncbi:MAG: universal stress protein [Myxococcales bacterium]|nr:universal stress protein [Myxococcales bacterium]